MRSMGRTPGVSGEESKRLDSCRPNTHRIGNPIKEPTALKRNLCPLACGTSSHDQKGDDNEEV